MIPSMRYRKNSWSLDDETTLRRLLLIGHTAQDVSSVLNRSVEAIANKARALGLSQTRTPEGLLRWYEPQSPPEGVVTRARPRAASEEAWSDPERPAPRFTPDYLPTIWTEAMRRISK